MPATHVEDSQVAAIARAPLFIEVEQKGVFARHAAQIHPIDVALIPPAARVVRVFEFHRCIEINASYALNLHPQLFHKGEQARAARKADFIVGLVRRWLIRLKLQPLDAAVLRCCCRRPLPCSYAAGVGSQCTHKSLIEEIRHAHELIGFK